MLKIGHKHKPETLYHLIKKYTYLIPSEFRDISLFDHIKVTSALATGLAKFYEGKSPETLDKNQKSLLIISGGISGIQRFIYRVASPQLAQEGMAKRLRGRSFYLNLLNDAVVTSILDKLGLPAANLIWCGGGNFLILASNTKNVANELDESRKEINHSLMKKFNAELFLGIVWEEASINDLQDFGKFKELIDIKLSGAKNHKFIDFMDELFEEETDFPPNTCSVCAGISKKDEKICDDCKKHEEIGAKLAYSKYYLKARTEEKEDSNKFDVTLFGTGYEFIEYQSNIINNISAISENSRNIQVLKINDTAFIDEALIKQCCAYDPDVSFGFSFIANSVPKYERQVLSFSNMAELSKGAKKLGILKMDVDSLGKIFSSGFGPENANIARISTMSSMLDLYFSGILNKLCQNYYFFYEKVLCEKCQTDAREVKITILENDIEIIRTVYRIDDKEKVCSSCITKKTPAIYINYAGGDDLLIIGPWDFIIELAKDIRKNFKDFTCKNSDLTISGGVYISDKKFPIGRAATLADELLDRSKHRGKNRMTVFGETVCWDTMEWKKGFDDLFEFSATLENHIESKKVSKGFIYSLLRMWYFNFGYDKEPNDKKRCECKAYIPHLKYKLVRAVNNEDNFRKEFDKEIQKMFPWIKIPVSWVSLRTR
jgi:CRISPR-associated protein Csm1